MAKAILLLDTQTSFSERQMQWKEIKCPFRKPGIASRKLKWTAKIVDYVEWIYALHGMLNTDTERITLKKIFEVFNGIFGLEVKDFSLYFMSIKNRKKGDRTPFLDEQKRRLTSRMTEADVRTARK